ncbi:MAG TPA: hypothetical protein VFF30_10145 [Nitrososphaerales archaeon]|nr:hypothetical protein [Nitrososphaerales archaeon]
MDEEERAVQKAGRSLAFYIPRQAKKYVEPGDIFKVSTRIVNGEMEIVAKRKIFNFDLNEVKMVAEKHGLKVKYDDEVDGTRIVDAADGKISLKSIQSKLEEPYGLIHVVLNARVRNLNPRDYEQSKKHVADSSSMSKFNFSLLPEGDANTVKLLEHPEYYLKKDEFDLFQRLERTGKTIDASITARLDNKRNKLDDIDEAFELIEKLEHTFPHS